MSSIARTISKSLGNLPLDRHSCQLLGPTALVSPAAMQNTVADPTMSPQIVQGFMGVLAILSLVYKRQRETQKRSWEIW